MLLAYAAMDTVNRLRTGIETDAGSANAKQSPPGHPEDRYTPQSFMPIHFVPEAERIACGAATDRSGRQNRSGCDRDDHTRSVVEKFAQLCVRENALLLRLELGVSEHT